MFCKLNNRGRYGKPTKINDTMNTLSLAEKFIIPFLVLILLYLKPTRRCLATLDTFFHESFHALLSLLLGNKVKEIQFKESIEGCCKSLSKSKFATTLTALAGYVGCSFFPLAIIYAIEHRNIEISFLIFAVFALVILILYIRNTFALVWTMAFAAINIACYMIPFSLHVKADILYIFLCIVVIENTMSLFQIAQLALTRPKNSGDCTLLHKTTHLPAFLWAVILNGINILAIYLIISRVFFAQI